MPCIYCEHCDKLIDLDYDVEHEADHQREENYQMFQVMPLLDVRKTHLRAAEWLSNNQALKNTETYTKMELLEETARDFLRDNGLKSIEEWGYDND